MDYVDHFHREVQAFSAAAREAVADDPAPDVPSCPAWTVTELVLHLGFVHRFVGRIFSERLIEPPDVGDWSWLELSAEHVGWLREMLAEQQEGLPASTPRAPRLLTAGLTDWFGTGAAGLETQFLSVPANEHVWTWYTNQTAGFWQRMQAIEAAIHRWDAEGATGAPSPVNTDLAVDAIAQTFEVMAPMRRTHLNGTPGRGERFRFRRSDGPDAWVVRFDDNIVALGDPDDPADVTAAGTASDLMLFLWHRLKPDALDVSGDASLLDRYFELVPPL